MMDSQFSQKFQIQDPYSIFQVPPQHDMDLEKSMECMIQSQNDFTQSIDRLEAKMSLLNTYRNEETLLYQY